MRSSACLMGLLLLGGCFAQTPDLQETPPTNAAATPNLNAAFTGGDVDVAMWAERFEGESREVFAQRLNILAALELKAGESVADIGAGTGLYVKLFAQSVSPGGTVYANDISTSFLDFIASRAAADGLTNVETVLGDDRSSKLPKASVDVVFHSDVYHHFERPDDMNADLYRALRPGGRLYVLDFERIPGVSDQRRLDHVRAPKETVMAEIQKAGFQFVREIELDGLEENYLIAFTKPDAQ